MDEEKIVLSDGEVPCYRENEPQYNVVKVKSGCSEASSNLSSYLSRDDIKVEAELRLNVHNNAGRENAGNQSGQFLVVDGLK